MGWFHINEDDIFWFRIWKNITKRSASRDRYFFGWQKWSFGSKPLLARRHCGFLTFFIMLELGLDHIPSGTIVNLELSQNFLWLTIYTMKRDVLFIFSLNFCVHLLWIKLTSCISILLTAQFIFVLLYNLIFFRFCWGFFFYNTFNVFYYLD